MRYNDRMSEKAAPRRKYARIDQSTWSEIEAHWETGDATLQELEARYGLSRRALQSHFSKRKLAKGSQAAEIAAVVKEKVFAQSLPDVDETAARAKATRETAYQNAVIVEDLVMAQLAAAQRDPAQALRAASAIKALSLAAAALERVHEIKWKALGLDKNSVEGDKLSVLVFEDLTEQEIQTMQEHDGNNDDFGDLEAPTAPEEDDEVLVIDTAEPASPEAAAVRPATPRFVRGAT